MKTIWILVTVIISPTDGETRRIEDHFRTEAKAVKAMAAIKLVHSIGWVDEEIVEQFIIDKPVY